MAKTKEQKKALLDELQAAAKDSKSLVFINYQGLKVEDETSLRKRLRDAGVNYKVVKKTILKKALNEAGFEGEMPEVEGMISLAYGEDLVAPAREVYQFANENKLSVDIVGGVFDQKFMLKDEMLDIATIPPTPVLYGQVVTLFNSPIQQFVAALGQIAEKKEA